MSPKECAKYVSEKRWDWNMAEARSETNLKKILAVEIDNVKRDERLRQLESIVDELHALLVEYGIADPQVVRYSPTGVVIPEDQDNA